MRRVQSYNAKQTFKTFKNNLFFAVPTSFREKPSMAARLKLNAAIMYSRFYTKNMRNIYIYMFVYPYKALENNFYSHNAIV